MGSLSLLCQFSPSPCTAGQECWGGLCRSSMQNTRVGAERTMQSRASNKTENGDPPSALCRAVKRETRGWEGAGGAAGKNPGEGLKEERPPQGSRWVPSEQDAHGAPGPSQRRGAGGGPGGARAGAAAAAAGVGAAVRGAEAGEERGRRGGGSAATLPHFGELEGLPGGLRGRDGGAGVGMVRAVRDASSPRLLLLLLRSCRGGTSSKASEVPASPAPRGSSGVLPHRPESAQRDGVGQDGQQVCSEEQDIQHVAHLQPLAGDVAKFIPLLEELADGGDLVQDAGHERRALCHRAKGRSGPRAPCHLTLPGVLAAVVVQLGCRIKRGKREKSP